MTTGVAAEDRRTNKRQQLIKGDMHTVAKDWTITIILLKVQQEIIFKKGDSCSVALQGNPKNGAVARLNAKTDKLKI